jgi:hypothetical protein
MPSFYGHFRENGRCDWAKVRGEMLTTDLGLIFEIRQIFVV